MRSIQAEIRKLTTLRQEEIASYAREIRAPLSLVEETAQNGHLPVPNFAAGGIATPADAALMMQLGAESVFVGSGIFLSEDPKRRAEAIVQAVTYYDDAKKLAEISEGLGVAMRGTDSSSGGETVSLAPGR